MHGPNGLFPEAYPFLGVDPASGHKRVWYREEMPIHYEVADIRDLTYGREFDIACGQIDVGNAATELASAMSTTGVAQAGGAIEREPTIDVEHVARAVVYMATLPLDPIRS